MRIELLVVPDCPNEADARAVIRNAARLTGIDVPHVITTVVRDHADAEARGFIGSPTILVNGRDPFAVPGAPTGLSCRVYVTAWGLAGVPSAEELSAALKEGVAILGEG